MTVHFQYHEALDTHFLLGNIPITGCCYQCINEKIYIGMIPNCSYIASNHYLNDLNKSAEGENVKIGDGNIVIKNFNEGNFAINDNQAKKLEM